MVLASRTTPPQAVVVSQSTNQVPFLDPNSHNGCRDGWERDRVRLSYSPVDVRSQATCGPLFKKMSHQQFSTLLLPATLKCLLRNPDELLEGRNKGFKQLCYFCVKEGLDMQYGVWTLV